MKIVKAIEDGNFSKLVAEEIKKEILKISSKFENVKVTASLYGINEDLTFTVISSGKKYSYGLGYLKDYDYKEIEKDKNISKKDMSKIKKISSLIEKGKSILFDGESRRFIYFEIN